MNQNNEVRKAILAFAKEMKAPIKLSQDERFLYFNSDSEFYETVFSDVLSDSFRNFCDLLREFDYIYFPSYHNLIAIGSLDLIDCKRLERPRTDQAIQKIRYSEEDVLS